MENPRFNPVEYAKTYYAERMQKYPLGEAEREYKNAKRKVEELSRELQTTHQQYLDLCVKTKIEPFSDRPGIRNAMGLKGDVAERNNKHRRLNHLPDEIRSAIRARIHMEEELVAVVAKINLAHYMKNHDDQDADGYIKEVMEYQDKKEDKKEEGEVKEGK